jgi:type II secretory pathway pseudopilin PulG
VIPFLQFYFYPNSKTREKQQTTETKMEIIIIGILALALLAGLALFVFKNAAKIVALVLVVFIGYIGWHIYLKDKGITPKQGIESVNKKGEKIFNGVMDSMIGSVSSASTKALDTAKEKTLEATEKVKDTSKRKATEITTKAKKKAKEKVNEVLE